LLFSSARNTEDEMRANRITWYAKSHGCIRLSNADVERLFERVRPGDVVELHAERTTDIDQLFASVH